MLKILWKRREIAPEEHICPLIHDIFLPDVRISMLKQGDKRSFQITEVEITRVDCIEYYLMYEHDRLG